MRPIHFISGLPRSGSTLLAALLRQNPRFHASMSSPVCGLLVKLLEEMSVGNEYALFMTDEQRRRILRETVNQYYGPEYPAEVIFDTNRSWCAQLPLLHSLFPGGRLIACVRDMPWVIDSIERLIRQNALSPSSIYNYKAGGTVYSRVDGVARADGMVGYAYNALKEAYFGEHAQSMMLVQYESLVSDPLRVLSAIYEFIGEPMFAHDPNNVEIGLDEFDRRAGTPGLHKVRKVVQAEQRQTILPPDLFRRFENDAFWLQPNANLRGVTII